MSGIQTLDTIFEVQLRKLIAERIDAVTTEIIGGAMDYETYKHRCGSIDGLRAALELMPDAREKAEQRNR